MRVLPFDSLRGRLVGLTSASVLISLVLVAGLHTIARSSDRPLAHLSNLLLGDEFPEPWQDVAILLPFSLVVLLLIRAITVGSLRPVLQASEQAARVGPSHPRARIAVRDLPSEIAPLVDAVNGALDRLAGAYETERRFTQDAAHELRTPLAALTMRLQRARLGASTDWDQIDSDLTRMRCLVSQLLDLARKESGNPRSDAPGTANLARLAREAAASLLPLIEHAGRAIEVDLPESAPVDGSADDLRDMIRNLIENALAHGSGRIGLALRVRGLLELEVTDEGRGVPPPLREAVFDRFRKVRQDGDGSGLGLAIARTVVTRHGGTIAFVDSPTCRVRVLLPHATTKPEALSLPKVA